MLLDKKNPKGDRIPTSASSANRIIRRRKYLPSAIRYDVGYSPEAIILAFCPSFRGV